MWSGAVKTSSTASPAKGKPEAMPLAKIMMSGSTASPLTCWWPHHLPVLATPDCTCSRRHCCYLNPMITTRELCSEFAIMLLQIACRRGG